MKDCTNTFATLLQQSWEEACSFFPRLSKVPIFWEIGYSAHFSSSRGFATTKTDGTSFWLTFSEKLLKEPGHRVRAIIRHEIGHVVDFSGIADPLADLPTTPERKADAIAKRIWNQPILYDTEGVQTLTTGTSPRPEKLGL
tara:strand:- start:205 stop:627 length:423 start_codon:yes stop_codon:yes gene_type:complete